MRTASSGHLSHSPLVAPQSAELQVGIAQQRDTGPPPLLVAAATAAAYDEAAAGAASASAAPALASADATALAASFFTSMVFSWL